MRVRLIFIGNGVNLTYKLRVFHNKYLKRLIKSFVYITCIEICYLCMSFHDIQSIQALQNQTEPHEYQPMFPNENCYAYQKI